MNKKIVSVIMPLALLIGGNAFAQATRIGVVNSDRIMSESLPAKTAQTKLEKEFSPRDKALKEKALELKKKSDAFENKFASLTNTEKEKQSNHLKKLSESFVEEQRKFQEDLNLKRNEELANLLERANKVIKSIAEREKYDLILQEAAYVNSKNDITDEVIKELNKNSK